MAKALYLVIFSRESWWVDFEGTPSGPYATRETAALEARAMARHQAATGRECDVLVPDGDGKYWVIWSSLYDRSDAVDKFVPYRVDH